jgi:L-2-hydroxyglutarate oxidase LhgO
VRGYRLMYEYCARRNVPHRRCGKLVVAATENERAALEALLERARSNGTGGVRWLDADAARALEPALRCVAAIDSPDSGIVDPAELCMALAGELEQANGRVVLNAKVARVRRADGGAFRVETATGDAVTCARLVNAAGLSATHVAAAIEGLDAAHVPRQYYGAGHYYGLHGKAPFSRLIYPMPEPHGLGVHLGFDFAGRVRFGPDVRFVDAPDYRFDDSRRAAFAASIRRWWPELRDEDLTPDFVGVRPKIHGPGEPQADFRIDDATHHGLPGLVNLFGIESPGLTSSLAIGEEVAGRLP